MTDFRDRIDKVQDEPEYLVSPKQGNAPERQGHVKNTLASARKGSYQPNVGPLGMTVNNGSKNYNALNKIGNHGFNERDRSIDR